MTPREIVEGAIELLQENGWCQVTPTLSDGSMCLEMALTSAAGQPGNYLCTALSCFSTLVAQGSLRDVSDALHRVLGEECGSSSFCDHAWKFNDVPDRTKDEVLSLLKDVYAELPI